MLQIPLNSFLVFLSLTIFDLISSRPFVFSKGDIEKRSVDLVSPITMYNLDLECSLHFIQPSKIQCTNRDNFSTGMYYYLGHSRLEILHND